MKRMALTLIVLLLISAVAETLFIKTVMAKTITVPDDYPTIQAAIDNANAGDTVYVKKGIYYHDGPLGQRIDGITIDKPISLIGEDSKTTILRPNYTSTNRLRSGIHVTADNVKISGFTIHGAVENVIYKNSLINFTGYQQVGVLVLRADNGAHVPYGCKITGNIFTGHQDYSVEDHGKNTLISGNTMTEGICLDYSSDAIVSGNNIEFDDVGIEVGSCVNVVIKQNNIVGNGYGISSGGEPFVGGLSLSNSGDGSIYIYENNITNSVFGIKFRSSNNCFVYNNNVMRNRIGVLLSNHAGTLGAGNMVYNNNIMDNEENAIVEHAYLNLSSLEDSYYEVSGNGTDVVVWDNGLVGNYWSDYNDQGAYVIDENNVDHHPLLHEVDVSSLPPEPVPILLIAVALVAVIAVVAFAGLLIYFKKRKR